jgi:hypothetical protein
MLTAERLGALFDVPVAVDRVGDYVYARPRKPAYERGQVADLAPPIQAPDGPEGWRVT